MLREFVALKATTGFVLTLGARFAVEFHLLEPLVELVGERPHPLRRHFFGQHVLAPMQDRLGVRDSHHQIEGGVLYALATVWPDEVDISSAAGDLDGVEESSVPREPFPSRMSTITAL